MKQTKTNNSGRVGKKKVNLLPYFFILPTIVSICAFSFYPFIRNIWLSLNISDNVGGAAKFVGTYNYEKIVSSGELLESFRDTVNYASCICIGTLILAMFLSFLCAQGGKGSGVYQTMYALPIAISSVPISIVVEYVFSRYGIVNEILGTETIWMQGMSRFVIIVLIVCWTHVGSSFIYLLVGFRNVSQDLVEAAELDGANGVTKFFKLYLPLASPQIFYVVFLNITSSFKSFTMIKLLAGTNADYLKTFSSRIYHYGFSGVARFEMACVFSILLFLVIFLVTRIQFIIEDKVVFYQ